MFVDLDRVIESLRTGQRFLVIGHIRPDGDDVSSVASLVMILRRMGKTAEGCIADPLPNFFERLSGDGTIKGVDELRDYVYDTSITVDSSDLARIGDAVELLENGMPDITLDHHKSNVGFGTMNFCDSAYAATAMIVYEIGKQLVEFDSALAETLLLGIATDTGFFRYTSADERVFAYAAALVRTGANIGRITQAILEHRTLDEIHLHTAMFKTLEISADGRLAAAYVTDEMMAATGCTDDDTAGLVGQLRAIGGVEVAIMFIESSQGTIHVSLRSKNVVDVSEIAIKFGGGGHARAAGCSVSDSKLDELMNDVIVEAEEAIKNTFSE
jgi:bifunctional oligoribonuclease and PAP phosphatase NrnA